MIDTVSDTTQSIHNFLEILPQKLVDAYGGSWLEINQAAFDHNINCYVNHMGTAIRIMLVLKSNAYGHGLETMAFLSQNNPHIAWIGTATLSEALRVRAIGVSKPILVLSHIDADPNLAHGCAISFALHDLQGAYALSQRATAVFPVHIKIDTGLSRFGLAVNDAVRDIAHMMTLPHLVVQGIYTHFALSGNVTAADIHVQNERFKTVLQDLALRGIHIPFCHAAKSVVAACVAQARYDAVRLGAGAYGLCAQESGLPLRQILTWKARIMHIRTVQAGAYIGYNRTYQAHDTMRIAVLPVGYYEGYPLNLSNKGRVFVCRTGQFASVVGRVCMNQMMIDVSHCSDIAVGDEVELMGDRPGITSADLTQACATNNERELVARINPLIQRIIV